MNQLQITPYNTLSELTKYRTYLILDSKMISVKYDGEGSIASKNLRILYSKI